MRTALAQLGILATLLLSGCGLGGSELEPGLGQRGMHPGQFVRPRGLAADPPGHPDPELFVVDFSGRIQVFDLDGCFRRLWQTPNIANGRPAALALSPSGEVAIADSHYQRVLIYNRNGELLRDVNGIDSGGPGKLGYIAGVTYGTDGRLFISEFDREARIHRFSDAGEYELSFGSQGTKPGQFARPRGLATLPDGNLVVADSCNHRLQIFTPEGKLVRVVGRLGTEQGELGYPYSVCTDRSGNFYTVEFSNHRVQKFNPRGEAVGAWGKPGRGPGQLHSPWGITVDARGVVWVADTENHRLLKIR